MNLKSILSVCSTGLSEVRAMHFVAECMRSSEVSMLEYCTRKCNPILRHFQNCCMSENHSMDVAYIAKLFT